VPFADLFNHKSEGEHVQIDGAEDVCPLCGQVSGCACDIEEESDAEWEDEETSVGGNESPADDDVPDAVPLDATSEDVAENEADESPVENDVLELLVVKDIVKGQEVFRSYGQHSNASLLRLYGFVEEDNPYSYVHVDRQQVLDKLQEVFPQAAEAVEDRLAFWDQVGRDIVAQLEDIEQGNEEYDADGCGDDCSHDHDHEHAHDDEDEEMDDEQEDCCSDSDCEGCDEYEEAQEDFCFERDGRPSFGLYAFLHLLLMSDKLFEKVATSLEDSIDMLVAIKNSELPLAKPKPAKGKGKNKQAVDPAVVLTRKVHSLLQKMAESRSSDYPEWTHSAKTLEGRAKMAWILRSEEIDILSRALQLLS
ncbi:hypothetical protein HDU91_006151, partial [Kappamyces sp. JEL0680]